MKMLSRQKFSDGVSDGKMMMRNPPRSFMCCRTQTVFYPGLHLQNASNSTNHTSLRIQRHWWKVIQCIKSYQILLSDLKHYVKQMLSEINTIKFAYYACYGSLHESKVWKHYLFMDLHFFLTFCLWVPYISDFTFIL